MIAELGPLALCFVVLVCLAAGFAHGVFGSLTLSYSFGRER